MFPSDSNQDAHSVESGQARHILESNSQAALSAYLLTLRREYGVREPEWFGRVSSLHEVVYPSWMGSGSRDVPPMISISDG